MTRSDRAQIEVKAMLIAPNEDGSAHAVSLNRPTAENPNGYHRLIGGGVELGETHHDALVREIEEELHATVRDVAPLGVVENIFHIDGALGHEIVFLYVGRLDPLPALAGASLTESDGTLVPVVWRRFSDDYEPVPLYPEAVGAWVRQVADEWQPR